MDGGVSQASFDYDGNPNWNPSLEIKANELSALRIELQIYSATVHLYKNGVFYAEFKEGGWGYELFSLSLDAFVGEDTVWSLAVIEDDDGEVYTDFVLTTEGREVFTSKRVFDLTVAQGSTQLKLRGVTFVSIERPLGNNSVLRCKYTTPGSNALKVIEGSFNLSTLIQFITQTTVMNGRGIIAGYGYFSDITTQNQTLASLGDINMYVDAQKARNAFVASL